MTDLDDGLSRLAAQAVDRELAALEGDVWSRVSAREAAQRRAAAAGPFGAVVAALALGLAAGGALPRSSAQAADLDIFSSQAALAPSTLLAIAE